MFDLESLAGYLSRDSISICPDSVLDAHHLHSPTEAVSLTLFCGYGMYLFCDERAMSTLLIIISLIPRLCEPMVAIPSHVINEKLDGLIKILRQERIDDIYRI